MYVLIFPPAMDECSPTPHSLQHKLSLVFLILANLTGIRWHPSVVLICISLMSKDVEHFLKCFLAVWDSSVENVLFSSVLHFLIELFRILMSIFWIIFIFWRSVFSYGVGEIFYHSIGCLFVLLTVCVLCFTEASQF